MSFIDKEVCEIDVFSCMQIGKGGEFVVHCSQKDGELLLREDCEVGYQDKYRIAWLEFGLEDGEIRRSLGLK